MQGTCLVVALQALGHAVVHDEPHVRLVDACIEKKDEPQWHTFMSGASQRLLRK